MWTKEENKIEIHMRSISTYTGHKNLHIRKNSDISENIQFSKSTGRSTKLFID